MGRLIILLKAAAILIFFASILVLYALFPNNFIENYYFIFSGIVFSFALACMAYIPAASIKTESTDGWLASLGIQSVFIFIFLIISFIALIFTIFNRNSIGLALDIIAITTFLVMLLMALFTSRNVDLVSKDLNFNSHQALWAEKLKIISLSCEDAELKSEIEMKAIECQFLARDTDKNCCEMNTAIDSIIDSLTDFVANSELASARSALNQYSAMVSRRELALKMKRSKV